MSETESSGPSPSPTLPPDALAVLDRLRQRAPHLNHLLRPEVRVHDANLDSLDVVEVLVAVETETGLRLTTDEVEKAITFGDLAAVIAARAAKGDTLP